MTDEKEAEKRQKRVLTPREKTIKREKQRYRQFGEDYTNLKQAYKVIEIYAPLKVGIAEDILADDKVEITPKRLQRILRVHCHSRKYLEHCKKISARFDLNGKTAGVLTSDQKLHAQEVLQKQKERFKQRKAEKDKKKFAKQKHAKKKPPEKKEWKKKSFEQLRAEALERAQLKASQPSTRKYKVRESTRPIKSTL